MEWISVKDKHPEDGRYVLVCGSNGTVQNATYFLEERMIAGKYFWFCSHEDSESEPLDYCAITHWMPLPEPPE